MPQSKVTPGAGPLGHAFGDPVLGSQRVFRALLTCLAEPGSVCRLEEPVAAPLALHASSARLLLTLADVETPVWLAPSLGDDVRHWVRFHCSAPLVARPTDAMFAVIDGTAAQPKLADFRLGDDRYPDTSATLIVQTAALAGGPAVTLAGPGLREPAAFAPKGLRDGFWGEVAENARRYPLGVDLVLVAGDAMAGLPRSTAVVGSMRERA